MNLPLSIAGLLLAVLGEACSVGLVGLSGWFIASSAVAGASAHSVFSYLAPSGGVRAFAVGRIATNYASRVVLHAAALSRISAARLGFYDRAAAHPSSHGTWSGESLDRVLADADVTGMALIQVTTPMVVALATTAGGCIAIVIAGYPGAAMIVAVSAASIAVLAMGGVRRADDTSRTRSALRTELVSAVEAWTEMASLGAVERLAQRTLRRLAHFENRRFQHAAAQARTAGLARIASAAALLLVVVSTSHSGADVSTLVFVALLATGVMQSTERLVPAAQARLMADQADERLASVGREQPRGRAGGPTFRVAYDRGGLRVHHYWLPETPTRPGRELDFAVAAGQTLILTGASGSGKTTLLDALATTLRETTPVVLTAVRADDYVFTGTISTNFRLANPAASDDHLYGLLSATLLDRSGLDPGTRIGVCGRCLSGGEQRRLHIARALATQPDVLLIDEPTTGLDASTATLVLGVLRRRVPHAVLVLATHELPADPNVLGPTWSTVSLD